MGLTIDQLRDCLNIGYRTHAGEKYQWDVSVSFDSLEEATTVYVWLTHVYTDTTAVHPINWNDWHQASILPLQPLLRWVEQIAEELLKTLTLYCDTMES